MKKIYLIIGMLMLSSISQAQDKNKDDSICGTYFKYLISKDGWYNYNECRGKISGNLFLMIFNEDSTFSSRVYSLSETCTFNTGSCDTTFGNFYYLGGNEIALQSQKEEADRKYGFYPCNAYRGHIFYLFKNKISDLQYENENQFNIYKKVIDTNKDKDTYVLDLRTYHSIDTSDSRKELIAHYNGVYYKFEIDKTEEGKIGVFKLLKLNDDNTFEYKLFHVYTNKVLKLNSATYIKGNYKYISEDIINITK